MIILKYMSMFVELVAKYVLVYQMSKPKVGELLVGKSSSWVPVMAETKIYN